MAISNTLAKGGRQLLLLDPFSGERMHAAVAVGNVDTADHVGVFTPGLTTTVSGSLSGYDDAMNALATLEGKQLDATGRGAESVANVTWIGYDAPQVSEIPDFGIFGGRADSVASADLAKQGGTALAGFFQGLNGARTDDFHLTAYGHSYGSTATGYALQHDGVGVDDTVLFGSPGPGTDDRNDLHSGHVYALAADGDPVAHLGEFGADPTTMTGITTLSDHDETIEGYHLKGSEGHGTGGDDGYLSNRTTSQYELAAIGAGLGDDDHLVHNHGDGSQHDTGNPFTDGWDEAWDNVKGYGPGELLNDFKSIGDALNPAG